MVVVELSDVPVRERFDYFQYLLSERQQVPLEVRCEQPLDMAARMRFTEFGSIGIACMSSENPGEYDIRRTPALIRRSDPELYRLLLSVHGKNRTTQGGLDAVLPPGDMAFYDSSLPFGVRRRPHDGQMRHECVIVAFPRTLARDYADPIRKLIGVRLSGRHGIGALVARFLTQLAADAEHYRPADRARLSTIVMDLLMTLAARETDDDKAVPPESQRRVLLLRVQSFVRQRLGDPALSPEMIAAEHHISVRTLHRLFQDHESSGVAGWIRECRLERCRQDLADPLLAKRPIHAIAARWGFSDAAHFSRVFRRAYDLTPQAYRDQNAS